MLRLEQRTWVGNAFWRQNLLDLVICFIFIFWGKRQSESQVTLRFLLEDVGVSQKTEGMEFGKPEPVQRTSKWVSMEAICISHREQAVQTRAHYTGCRSEFLQNQNKIKFIWCALAFGTIITEHLTELFEHLEKIKDKCIENQANKTWSNFSKKKNCLWVNNKQCTNKHY